MAARARMRHQWEAEQVELGLTERTALSGRGAYRERRITAPFSPMLRVAIYIPICRRSCSPA